MVVLVVVVVGVGGLVGHGGGHSDRGRGKVREVRMGVRMGEVRVGDEKGGRGGGRRGERMRM